MRHIAEPEWLGRKDAEHGAWQVEDCEPRRGIPATSIVERKMLAPAHDTEQARVIRAHEMMHAKVSPANDWEKWQNRKIATLPAMMACEELRVNLLCDRAGFDVKNQLSDGGETADGERLACTEDWKGAVHMTVATAGTASNKLFLNGIRRHNRLWGTALADISKRAVKEMNKAGHRLSSTEVHATTGLAPFGFIYTEKLAEWVDRLAGMEPPSEDESESSDDSSMSTEGDDKESKREHSNIGSVKVKETEFREKLKTITPDRMDNSVPYWGELMIEKLPLPIIAKGNLGKKKTASNIGRSPRRIHRYMTDPQKRIFDNKRRGMGGVVCVDASGSMSLSHDDVRRILEASPGATVIAYSDIRDGHPNAWILADKGRMVDEMPEMGQGNGVDFPALEWAVKRRQHSTAPVIWMTDGGVCGPHQGFSELLANQCTAFCLEKKIHLTEDAEATIALLGALSKGVTIPKSRFPYMLKHAWESRGGKLPD
jgi:hypothetical protein